MTGKNHWLTLCVLLFPQFLWGLEDQQAPDAAQLNREALTDSLEVLTSHLQDNPKDGDAYMQLGWLALKREDFKQAEEAFKKAIRYKKSAQAYRGLGLTYANQKGKHQKAFYNLRRALAIDPNMTAVKMDIARLQLKDKSTDAVSTLKGIVKDDPSYAPAHMALAEWYAEQKNKKKMLAYFKSYLQLVPQDADFLYQMALNYAKNYRYKPILEIIEQLPASHADKDNWLPLQAQAYAAIGEVKVADYLFQRFLRLIPEDERRYYDNITLMMSPEEQNTFSNLKEEEQGQFINAFWKKRDPLLSAGGNIRKVEHYRRVWYARQFFNGKQPWDRRGEVYIKFGEPDHKFGGNHGGTVPPLSVEFLKERLAYEFALNLQRAERVEQVPEWNTLKRKQSKGALTDPVYPIDRLPNGSPIYPWESWIYLGIGKGIEIVFTDHFMNGSWDYPLPPKSPLLAVASQNFHPQVIIGYHAKETPDFYNGIPGTEILNFYYDLATFRGKDLETDQNIYLGLLPKDIFAPNDTTTTSALVNWTASLVNDEGTVINSAQHTVSLSSMQGGIAIDAMSLKALPGDYRLIVHLTDQNSGKWGFYQQQVHIPNYAADSLSISDIEMAYHIFTEPQSYKFQKGDVWVIPMPTRNYLRNQAVNIYYEIYNLQKDAFGQTKYRIKYTIWEDKRKNASLLGSISSFMGKLVTDQKPEISISSDYNGNSATEPVYIELDTKKLNPGLYQLEVEVHDLISQQTSSQEALFILNKNEINERVTKREEEALSDRFQRAIEGIMEQ